MFSVIRSAALGAAVVAGLGQVASAGYVIGPDNFQSYSLGPIVGQHGWVDSLGNGGPGATIVDTGMTGHDQALLIDNTTANSVDLAIPAAYSQSDLRVQYDVYGTNAPDSTFTMPSMAVLGKDTVLNTGGLEVKLEGMGPDNSTPSIFRVNGDNNKKVNGISSVQHTWYTVTIDMTLSNPRSYDVTITDGTSTGTLTNVPYYYETAVPRPFTDWDTIRFFTNDYGGNPAVGAKGSGYFDNLSIQTLPVPEPATAAVLMIAGAGLVVRRRK